MKKLGYCPRCKENSVMVVGAKPRAYDGKIKRKEICVNEGCRHTMDLDPHVETVKALKKKAVVLQGQQEFVF